ncbi:MAG TPA: hypothetical protein VIH28_02635 [Ignavibacteriaceae bacterium]
MIIVLNDSGEMSFVHAKTLGMEDGFILYCPPCTEHDVINTGKKLLKYIYVAAKIN